MEWAVIFMAVEKCQKDGEDPFYRNRVCGIVILIRECRDNNGIFNRRRYMSLQFIIGSSGSGKSCYAYQNIIEQAGLHPDKLYYVIVPEQFTMQTQKTLVEMSPGKGILNIDILSFERLAYRVLEEVEATAVHCWKRQARAWCFRKWSSSMAKISLILADRCARQDIWMR